MTIEFTHHRDNVIGGKISPELQKCQQENLSRFETICQAQELCCHFSLSSIFKPINNSVPPNNHACTSRNLQDLILDPNLKKLNSYHHMSVFLSGLFGKVNEATKQAGSSFLSSKLTFGECRDVEKILLSPLNHIYWKISKWNRFLLWYAFSQTTIITGRCDKQK